MSGITNALTCFVYRLTHSSQPILVKPTSSGSMSTIALPSVNPAVIVSLIVPPRPLSRSQEQKGLLNETFSSLLDTYVPASISTPTSHVYTSETLGELFPRYFITSCVSNNVFLRCFELCKFEHSLNQVELANHLSHQKNCYS